MSSAGPHECMPRHQPLLLPDTKLPYDGEETKLPHDGEETFTTTRKLFFG